MTRIYYWESIFFAGLFGFIALYPAVISTIPYLAGNYLLFLLLSSASIALFLTLLLYREFYETRRARWIIISAALASLAVIGAGFSLMLTTPTTVVWFINSTLALFSFGYIIAKHFLRRVEHDFRAHSPKIILGGLAVTLFMLLVAHALTIFPVGLIALITFIAVILATIQ